MASNLDGKLLGIEKRLASLGLPAGPDNVINHKALLGLFFGILGAFIGWLLTEPYSEEFTFWRDFLILSVVGLMICFFVMLTDWVFERTFWAFFKAVFLSVLSTAIIIVPSVLIAKHLLTPTSHKSTLYLEAGVKPLKVLVLDVSGSMEGDPLETLKRAVQAYVNVIQQNDKEKRTRLACVVFSNKALIVAEPTNDLSLFVDQVNKVKAEGATNMAEGLLFAENIFKKSGSTYKSKSSRKSSPTPDRKVFLDEVIMVSDGKPNVPNERRALADVQDRLQFFMREGHPLHAVGAGKEYDRLLMEQLASKTGGTFVPADDVAKLIPVMEKFAHQGFTQSGKAGDEKIGPWTRIVGWVVIGIAIGICAALPRKSFRSLALGIVGGIAGGLVGSVFFEILQYVVDLTSLESGLINRCIGFMVLGASIGFAVPVVETVGRPAWLRILEGRQTGRVVVLEKSSMILGSGKRADIRIDDDPDISEKNIRFTKIGDDLEVQCLDKENLTVNGAPNRKTIIRNGETFEVGNTEFVYINKLTGFGIQKGGFEKLDLSAYRQEK